MTHFGKPTSRFLFLQPCLLLSVISGLIAPHRSLDIYPHPPAPLSRRSQERGPYRGGVVSSDGVLGVSMPQTTLPSPLGAGRRAGDGGNRWPHPASPSATTPPRKPP